MCTYILIAGVNGAGKSTLYRVLDSLQNVQRVNIDEIVREFGSWRNQNDMLKAGRIAVQKIHDCFENRETFQQETTLCGKSILRNIKTARALGYRIEMHYVGIATPELAKKRIAWRVAHGGHGIPDADVERRYCESFENLKSVLSECDKVIFYDNTERFHRIAVYQNGIPCLVSESQPEWFQKLQLPQI